MQGLHTSSRWTYVPPLYCIHLKLIEYARGLSVQSRAQSCQEEKIVARGGSPNLQLSCHSQSQEHPLIALLSLIGIWGVPGSPW